MAKAQMTSKERIRATLKREPVDHLPMCLEGVGHPVVRFMLQRHPDVFERAARYLEMGIDCAVQISPPYFSMSGVRIKEWEEQHPQEEYPLMVREYLTPRGALRQVVRRYDYPYESVRLFSDHNVPPSRSKQYLVEDEEDLDALEHILQPPEGEELEGYRKRAAGTAKFCEEKGVLFAGHLPGVGDPLLWMSGFETVAMSPILSPAFVERYVGIVSEWNRALLAIQLEAGVDLVVRRGWYENCEFWPPGTFRKYLFGPLKEEIDTAHRAGACYTYIMDSRAAPMLDIFRDLGFDIYSNVDPDVIGMGLDELKREIGADVTFYGGVNNYHVLERGTMAGVRRAVFDAVKDLSPGGGFILGPGDSVDYQNADPETAERNVNALIKAWEEIREDCV